MIRLTIPAIDEQCLAAVREVLETGFLVQGERVAAFEAAIAEYVGCEHAVAVNSGTSALHLSLLALGICDGDRVIVARILNQQMLHPNGPGDVWIVGAVGQR